MKKLTSKVDLIIIVTPLVLSGLIYYVGRPQKPLILEKFNLIIGAKFEINMPYYSGIPGLYTIPDFLWALSFGYSVAMVISGFSFIQTASLYAFALLTALMLEFLQMTDLVAGTFDANDVLVIFLGFSIGIAARGVNGGFR